MLGSDLRVLLVLKKRCSSNVNVTTTITKQKLLQLSCTSYVCYVCTYLKKLLPSPEICISCLQNRKPPKRVCKLWCQSGEVFFLLLPFPRTFLSQSKCESENAYRNTSATPVTPVPASSLVSCIGIFFLNVQVQVVLACEGILPETSPCLHSFASEILGLPGRH